MALPRGQAKSTGMSPNQKLNKAEELTYLSRSIDYISQLCQWMATCAKVVFLSLLCYFLVDGAYPIKPFLK